MSFGSWEIAAFWVLIVSNVGLFVASAVLIRGLVGEYHDPHSTVTLAVGSLVLKKFPLLVIIGVGGELLFNALIFASSITLEVLQSANVENARIEASTANRAAGEANERAGEANKLAGEANERAAKANERADQLENENLKLRQQMAGVGGRISVVENRTADRDIDGDQRRTIRRHIDGHRRPVTIVRLDDREAHDFAGKLHKALTAAHFVVTETDFGHTSPLVGVIVCENGGAEVKLFDALKAADIAAERRPSTDKYVQDHPPECQPDFTRPTAIRIFVGQRK